MLGHLFEAHGILVAHAIRAEVQRTDQRAVDDQVGVAADGRGEVRVLQQVQAEVAEILVGVAGLRLRAQHHLVDEVFVLGAPHIAQQLVEASGR